jgi:alkanesulfonate monooxygenase SsuD/methylene tetrahydromethanopterin reductase-like flavin-dependent oxidoreductase (luciferase family)
MLSLMYRGAPFEFSGTHYHAHRPEMMVPPPTLQQPRVPTWVVGLLGAPKSMSRVARWDGWLPNYPGPDGAGSPDALTEGVTWLREERARAGLTMDSFDVVVEGITEPGDSGAARGWAEAGATWWLEANWMVPADSCDLY